MVLVGTCLSIDCWPCIKEKMSRLRYNVTALLLSEVRSPMHIKFLAYLQNLSAFQFLRWLSIWIFQSPYKIYNRLCSGDVSGAVCTLLLGLPKQLNALVCSPLALLPRLSMQLSKRVYSHRVWLFPFDGADHRESHRTPRINRTLQCGWPARSIKVPSLVDGNWYLVWIKRPSPPAHNRKSRYVAGVFASP